MSFDPSSRWPALPWFSPWDLAYKIRESPGGSAKTHCEVVASETVGLSDEGLLNP